MLHTIHFSIDVGIAVTFADKPKSFLPFLSNPKLLPNESEVLSKIDVLNEIIMIGLRTSDGIDLEFIKSEFSDLNLDNLSKQIELKIKEGILVKTNNKLHTSKEYKFLTDGVASDLFVTN